ncbi:folate-binding protein YgfZ [Proteobacteria bacterium 005FR1]|nr:folate-binding protein YgfZ [Proteobacteria bacterium 005FR1]
MVQDNWQSLLDSQGAQRDEFGVREFSGQAESRQAQLMALDHLAYLLVEGPEAKKFLQGQVTCDINLVTSSHAQRGGHCNTKGRLIFSFLAVSLPSQTTGSDRVALVMHRDLVEKAQQALAKFIVFSKAKLSTAQEHQLIGLQAGDAPQLLSRFAPELPIADEDTTQSDQLTAVRIGAERLLCLVKKDQAASCWQSWAEKSSLHGYNLWHLADIRDGLGQVLPGSEDMFIPQMLNMHLTGGISFTKGCYVGQEVVARMQYLGKLKRHMRRLQLAASDLPAPGTAVYSAESDSSQSVGNVVMAAKADGHIELLAVTTDSAFESDALFLDAEKTQKLNQLSLPYVITK